jgi:hypothetical protein
MTPLAARPEIESPHLVALNGDAIAIRNGAARRHVVVLRLGDLLVSEGLATHAEVQKALRVQSQSATYMPLGHILVAQKVITRSQLLSVLDRHRRRSKLGELLIKSQAITAGQLETALAEQRRWKQTLGEVVVRLKVVTEEQIRRALCQQLHINYFDLDTIVLDHSLRALINPRFVKKRLVVPIEHRLRNGHADPARGLQVDHQLERRRLLDRQLGGPRAFQDPVDEATIRRASADVSTLVTSNGAAPASVGHQVRRSSASRTS